MEQNNYNFIALIPQPIFGKLYSYDKSFLVYDVENNNEEIHSFGSFIHKFPPTYGHLSTCHPNLHWINYNKEKYDLFIKNINHNKKVEIMTTIESK
jgi:hypothetical protein